MKRPTRAPRRSHLPAVNLLSPWVLETITALRLRRRFSIAAVVLALLLGAGWAVQHLRTGQAQQLLSVEQAETETLTAQANELAPVRGYVLTVAAQKVLVQTTMSNEVYLSRVLGALKGAAPAAVDVQTATITVTPPVDPAAAQVGGAGSACPGPDPFNTRTVVGCVTLSGTANSRASVGEFVVNLGSERLFVEPFISTTTTAEGDEVLFTGSVGLSEKALSRRYDDIDALLTRSAGR